MMQVPSIRRSAAYESTMMPISIYADTLEDEMGTTTASVHSSRSSSLATTAPLLPSLNRTSSDRHRRPPQQPQHQQPQPQPQPQQFSQKIHALPSTSGSTATATAGLRRPLATRATNIQNALDAQLVGSRSRASSPTAYDAFPSLASRKSSYPSATTTVFEDAACAAEAATPRGTLAAPLALAPASFRRPTTPASASTRHSDRDSREQQQQYQQQQQPVLSSPSSHLKRSRRHLSTSLAHVSRVQNTPPSASSPAPTGLSLGATLRVPTPTFRSPSKVARAHDARSPADRRSAMMKPAHTPQRSSVRTPLTPNAALQNGATRTPSRMHSSASKQQHQQEQQHVRIASGSRSSRPSTATFLVSSPPSQRASNGIASASASATGATLAAAPTAARVISPQGRVAPSARLRTNASGVIGRPPIKLMRHVSLASDAQAAAHAAHAPQRRVAVLRSQRVRIGGKGGAARITRVSDGEVELDGAAASASTSSAAVVTPRHRREQSESAILALRSELERLRQSNAQLTTELQSLQEQHEHDAGALKLQGDKLKAMEGVLLQQSQQQQQQRSQPVDEPAVRQATANANRAASRATSRAASRPLTRTHSRSASHSFSIAAMHVEDAAAQRTEQREQLAREQLELLSNPDRFTRAFPDLPEMWTIRACANDFYEAIDSERPSPRAGASPSPPMLRPLPLPALTDIEDEGDMGGDDDEGDDDEGDDGEDVDERKDERDVALVSPDQPSTNVSFDTRRAHHGSPTLRRSLSFYDADDTDGDVAAEADNATDAASAGDSMFLCDEEMPSQDSFAPLPSSSSTQRITSSSVLAHSREHVKPRSPAGPSTSSHLETSVCSSLAELMQRQTIVSSSVSELVQPADSCSASVHGSLAPSLRASPVQLDDVVLPPTSIISRSTSVAPIVVERVEVACADTSDDGVVNVAAQEHGSVALMVASSTDASSATATATVTTMAMAVESSAATTTATTTTTSAAPPATTDVLVVDTNDPTENGENFVDQFPFERNLYALARHYQFITRLYTCDDAVTFKCVHVATGAPVVLKISQGYALDRYDPKEVRVLTSAQGHRNVMKMLCWHVLPKTQCYVVATEFIENTNIEVEMFGRLDNIRAYMFDLLHGLRFLHSRHILHRDIKPSNVLWNPKERRAVIIDFDVAAYHDGSQLLHMYVGTPGFMAPEVDVHQHDTPGNRAPGYSFPTDVYSCGVTMGQLLFCKHEFDVAQAHETEAKGDAFRRLSLDMLLELFDASTEADLEYRNAFDLLVQLLDEDAAVRITIDEALGHPFFAGLVAREAM